MPGLVFFAPQGRHVAAMGMKFGSEEWTDGPLIRAKFHPNRFNDKDIKSEFFTEISPKYGI